jgi:PAS domain S-box-containing protein
MNAFALLSLFASILTFCLGVLILLRDPRNPLHRVFMLLCMFLAFWAFTEFGYRQADSAETASVWLRASSLSFLVAPLALHFVLIFTGEAKLFRSQITYLFLYLPALMFAVLGITTDVLGSEMVREYWGWRALTPEDPLLQAVAYAWAYGLGIISVYLCLLHFLRVSDEKRKQQTKFVFIGFSVVLATGLVTDWLLPLLGVAVPEATTAAFTVACVCGGYAMWKYDLFAITPTAAAEGIISTMPDALLLVGLDGRIALANEATLRMLGYSEDELVGQSIRSVLPDDKAEMALGGPATGPRASAGSGRAETCFSTKTGVRVPVHLSTSVMVGRDGRLRGTIYIGRDITELKLAEEEKLRMEHQLQIAGRLAAVGELSAGVAHELNNPLAAIQAFAQFLASRDNLDTAIKRDVETIYREAQRASRITGNLLSFARRSRPEKRVMSINEAVERSVELYAYRMKASNIEVRMELDPDLPEALADAEQMHQVFVNIVKNAEEAMAASRGQGVLSVKTQRAGDFIRITFADNGPGIPKADLENVFDPFFTTKDVGKGTGLGLSICYGIVENHGGRIHAWSNPSEGAVFVVEIPIVDGAGPDAGGAGLSSAAADALPY